MGQAVTEDILNVSFLRANQLSIYFHVGATWAIRLGWAFRYSAPRY